MNKLPRFFVATLVGALALAAQAGAQSWTPLTHQPTFHASTSLLLTDGSVMVHQSDGTPKQREISWHGRHGLSVIAMTLEQSTELIDQQLALLEGIVRGFQRAVRRQESANQILVDEAVVHEARHLGDPKATQNLADGALGQIEGTIPPALAAPHARRLHLRGVEYE